ncbi:peroxisome biogenesis factor 13-like protein [Dinothrombium tinctorium]|uniref:Peroxisomal membrane protein PEX13 n=1 Tax=Dinothrombium tinctorium TaxID=1965070 RepID=A0A443QDS7_9ACAR|nr:peroxisome biogenesis factor 13-like protein [Dinothrombium tinctorium]
MSSPLKPWEKESDFQLFSNAFHSTGRSSQQMGNASKSANNNPPPLPPRPQQQRNSVYNRLGRTFTPFGIGYSSPYYSPIHGGYAGYSSFGYNRYPAYGSAYPPAENDFFRLAEEGSRQAFHSIESIVQAFASVSMMLESTYFALQSSFRAVLGVAEQMASLKAHLVHVVSSLAILKTLKWFVQKVLYVLGIVRTNPQSRERIWKIAEATTSSNSDLNADAIFNSLTDERLAGSGFSSWPIIIFFSVVFGMPWLFWRFISSITGTESSANSKWKSGEDDHYIAQALYDFTGEDSKELSFVTGQQIIIAPKHLQPQLRGWLLASIDNKTGLIPSNYIKILEFRKAPFQNTPDASFD